MFQLQVKSNPVLRLYIHFQQLQAQVCALGFRLYGFLKEITGLRKTSVSNVDFHLAQHVGGLRRNILIIVVVCHCQGLLSSGGHRRKGVFFELAVVKAVFAQLPLVLAPLAINQATGHRTNQE